MLKFIREYFGKGFMMVLVALMAFVFVAWGVFPEMRGKGFGGGVSDVATVGDERISLQDLQSAVNRELDMYKQFGQTIPESVVPQIRRQALMGLVNQRLLGEEGKRLGINPSDEAVRAEILKYPFFQNKETKQFDKAQYDNVLAANHLSPSEFEDRVRSQLRQQMLMEFLQARLLITDSEVQREFQITGEERNIEFVRFSREAAYTKMTVSSDEMNKFLADKVHDAEVRAFYAQNSDKYNKDEQVCARHILFKDAASKSEAAPAAMLAVHPTAKNFAALAEKFSQDPSAKGHGGDLSCFARGMMDKNFEAAAFAAPINTVTKPVHSSFGWHYILVYKKNAASHRSLDEAKKEIAEDLIKRGRFEEIQKINQEEANAAMKSWPPKGVKLETTGWFNHLLGTIPQIGHADEILHAAFDPNAPIQKGPQMFQAQGAFIVAKMKESRSADMNKYAAAKETELKTLRERKFRAFMPAWMEDVKSRIKVSLNEKVLSQL